MNGTNGSTVFSGEKGVAWTTNGNAYISTNQFKYGGASGAFPGTTGYISAVQSPAFNFTTNDFTIEFWVNVTTISGTNDHIFSKTNNPRTQGWGLDCTGGTDAGWDFWMNNDTTGQTPFFTIPNKTWTHVAVVRQSGVVKVYINGNLTVTSTNSSGNYDTIDPMWIGRQQNNFFNGFIDEFRISVNKSRWKSNFTPPYNEYKGILETNFPDINPNSTFRYKTDPPALAYIDNVSNGGTRNRTLQIQNITNTSYVMGEMTFNPLYVYVKSVQLNTSYFPTGLSLVSSSIDNTNGLIQFNITRPAGFFNGINRSSILDYTALYYNYTDGTDNLSQFFGFGFLVNGTTSRVYPIHNFLVTQVTYGDWNFTANFVANNLTVMNGTPTFFISSFTGSYPNRWNWSFGDGTVDNGINSSVSHTYNSGGMKHVRLTEYLWQNTSVSNATLKSNYITVLDAPPEVNFTSNVTTGINPTTVQFNDTSTGIVSNWNWSFKNVTGNGTQIWFSTSQDPVYTFGIGNWSITLNASNANGGVNTSDGNYYINVSPIPIPIVDFSANDTEGSTPLVVQFTDNSLGCVTNWNWSFRNITGNNTQVWFSTIQNPLHTFGIGNFSIHLNASNPTGSNISTKVFYINVSTPAAPIADFTSITSGGPTPPVTVNFNDTSTNSPTSWLWEFGDGNTSILQNPVHIYEFCGNFTVDLRAQNLIGFSWNNKSNYVIVACPAPPTPTPTPSAGQKIENKITDTQNLIIIGIIVLAVAFIATFIAKHATKS